MSKKSFKVDKSLVLRPQTEPIGPQDGELYYDQSLDKFRKHERGQWRDLGSGTGVAIEITEDLKARLRRSIHKFVTPFVFSQQEEGETDSGNTTAVFNNADLVYDFQSGQILQTINQLGARFLGTSTPVAPEADEDLASAEVHLIYTEGSEDPAPIVRLSRDGGNEFQEAIVERVGLSNKFRAFYRFEEESVSQTLFENEVANADSQIALSGGGANEALAIPITVTNKLFVKELTLYLNKLGAPLGNFSIELVKEDSGFPSTNTADIVGSTGLQSTINLSAGNNSVILTIKKALKPGNYWFVINTDQAYKSSFDSGVDELRWRADNSSPTYSNGSTFNGTVWTTTSGSSFVFLAEGREHDLRVQVEASQNDVLLEGIGTFYGDRGPGFLTGIKARHVFRFSGDNDDTEFEIPIGKFLPDADMLEVFDVNSGQVYKYPAFELQGQTIKFGAGTFLSPGEEVILIADQTKGGGFDNSDQNASLMAANGLGSTDLSVDRSSPGVGVKNRASDGILYNVVPLAGGIGIEITEA
jgi:hypothetical protein